MSDDPIQVGGPGSCLSFCECLHCRYERHLSPASSGNTAAESEGIVERERKVGDHLVYTDEQGIAHNALVTNWWGPQCCNLLFVVSDEAKKDPYGQQIERRSSSVHKSMMQAPGNFWLHPDEVI